MSRLMVPDRDQHFVVRTLSGLIGLASVGALSLMGAFHRGEDSASELHSGPASGTELLLVERQLSLELVQTGDEAQRSEGARMRYELPATLESGKRVLCMVDEAGGMSIVGVSIVARPSLLTGAARVQFLDSDVEQQRSKPSRRVGSSFWSRKVPESVLSSSDPASLEDRELIAGLFGASGYVDRRTPFTVAPPPSLLEKTTELQTLEMERRQYFDRLMTCLVDEAIWAGELEGALLAKGARPDDDGPDVAFTVELSFVWSSDDPFSETLQEKGPLLLTPVFPISVDEAKVRVELLGYGMASLDETSMTADEWDLTCYVSLSSEWESTASPLGFERSRTLRAEYRGVLSVSGQLVCPSP